MLKKVMPVVLSLCLIFSISVMAENTAINENTPNASLERPVRGDFDPSKIPEGDFDPSKMPEGFTPPEGDFTLPQNFGEFTPPQSNESNNVEASVPETNEGVAEENPKGTENGEESGHTQSGNSPFGGQMPEGMGGFPGNMQSGQNAATEQPTGFLGFVKTYSTPITSVVLLGLAYLFVVFYKRKHY